MQGRDERIEENSKKDYKSIDIYKGGKWKEHLKTNLHVPCQQGDLLLMPHLSSHSSHATWCVAVWWVWSVIDPAENKAHPHLTFQLNLSLTQTDHTAAWSAMALIQWQPALRWVGRSHHPAAPYKPVTCSQSHLTWDSVRQVYQPGTAGQLCNSGLRLAPSHCCLLVDKEKFVLKALLFVFLVSTLFQLGNWGQSEM